MHIENIRKLVERMALTISHQQSVGSPFDLPYQISEKEEAGSLQSERGNNSPIEYEPKLSIRTHKNEQSITIDIQDNGPGIPDDIKDKILQPFFTTKKGTAGTGLGLSITNDIIKAHGGELVVNTSFSGTTFTILLKKQK